MQHDRPSSAPGVSRLRVLILDRDTGVRQLMASALRGVADVCETDRVDAALQCLEVSRNDLDAVVVSCLRFEEDSDYATAVDFVRAVFRRCLTVPVVVVGNSADAARFRADLLLTGLREVVTTPVEPASVVGALQRVTGGRPRRRPASSRNVAAVRRILAVLEQRPKMPPLFELAEMATMSRSHFSRTFHAVVGVSLRQYGRDVLLKRAHDLLLDRRLSLTTVAVQAGFYDLPHLDKVFRRRLGMSPREFRNRYDTCRTT